MTSCIERTLTVRRCPTILTNLLGPNGAIVAAGTGVAADEGVGGATAEELAGGVFEVTEVI